MGRTKPAFTAVGEVQGLGNRPLSFLLSCPTLSAQWFKMLLRGVKAVSEWSVQLAHCSLCTTNIYPAAARAQDEGLYRFSLPCL